MLTIVKPYVDTPIAGNPTLSLPLAPVNFPADFAVVSDVPGEVQVTNTTCPTDRPEKFRFAYSEVKDVFKGTGIDPNLFTPSRYGASVLVQLTDIYSITDSVDPKYQAALPLSGHIVLKVPNNQLLTGEMIKAFLGRLSDGVFNTGVTDTIRLQSLLRGSLKPKGL